MIAIKYLREYQDQIPIIAKWYYEEWPELYPNLDFVIQRLKSRISNSKLPIGFVAVENAKVIGAITLKDYDIESRKELSPCLASLIVQKEKRKQGIGKLLIEGVLEKCKEFGFKKIYLYTDSAKEYYASLGWTEIGSVIIKNKEASIFERFID